MFWIVCLEFRASKNIHILYIAMTFSWRYNLTFELGTLCAAPWCRFKNPAAEAVVDEPSQSWWWCWWWWWWWRWYERLLIMLRCDSSTLRFCLCRRKLSLILKAPMRSTCILYSIEYRTDTHQTALWITVYDAKRSDTFCEG